jgi:hypothetical protein
MRRDARGQIGRRSHREPVIERCGDIFRSSGICDPGNRIEIADPGRRHSRRQCESRNSQRNRGAGYGATTQRNLPGLQCDVGHPTPGSTPRRIPKEPAAQPTLSWEPKCGIIETMGGSRRLSTDLESSLMALTKSTIRRCRWPLRTKGCIRNSPLPLPGPGNMAKLKTKKEGHAPLLRTYGHQRPDSCRASICHLTSRHRISVVNLKRSGKKQKPNKISEWQDLNLRPLRPERKLHPKR